MANAVLNCLSIVSIPNELKSEKYLIIPIYSVFSSDHSLIYLVTLTISPS